MRTFKKQSHSIGEINFPPWMIDSIRRQDKGPVYNREENILQLPLYIPPQPETLEQPVQEIIDYVIETGMEMNSYA